MTFISTYIEYLKNPNLVVSFQKHFGVQSKNDSQTSKTTLNKRITPNNANEININNVKHRNLKTNSNNANSDILSTAEEATSESDIESPTFIIKNKFWYYFFLFGTYLGDEVFYATFLPFWFWNIDGAVGRRIVMVWAIIMYIGQGLKDIICWPRPSSPPVFRLQKKWSLEYGMPSTHAMVGIAIPFSVIIYTMSRYQYPVELGVVVAVFWCATISLSRIYLGMHSVLDVVAGLLLAIVLMFPVVPLVDALDVFLVIDRWSPLYFISVTIPMIAIYPSSSHWTPTRGDTTLIVGFCVGVYVGAWTHYHMGDMIEPSHPPPYTIIWPSWPMCGTGALRTVIGLCSVVATMAVSKFVQHTSMSCLLTEEERTQHTSLRTAIELTNKYLTFVLMGFNVVFLMPKVFNLLRIDRPTFYTEL